ncbi:unnamed protein product [Sphagnum troendelagicum]
MIISKSFCSEESSLWEAAAASENCSGGGSAAGNGEGRGVRSSRPAISSQVLMVSNSSCSQLSLQELISFFRGVFTDSCSSS